MNKKSSVVKLNSEYLTPKLKSAVNNKEIQQRNSKLDLMLIENIIE